MPWRSNIMELEGARPRKSTLGFWVLVFNRDLRVGDESLGFADHFHFPESAWGLAQALEQVEVARQAGLIGRIVHIKRQR